MLQFLFFTTLMLLPTLSRADLVHFNCVPLIFKLQGFFGKCPWLFVCLFVVSLFLFLLFEAKSEIA